VECVIQVGIGIEGQFFNTLTTEYNLSLKELVSKGNYGHPYAFVQIEDGFYAINDENVKLLSKNPEKVKWISEIEANRILSRLRKDALECILERKEKE